MIVVGPIANFMRAGRPMRSTHLLSDLTGLAGTGELMGFGMKIGLKAGWLQAGGGAHEHFDLTGSKINQAIDAGALRVDRYRLVSIIREKREYQQRHKPRKEIA